MSEELVEPDDDGGAGEALIPGPAPLTPSEALFVSAFADVESEFFGRATLSAEKAGYASPRDSAWKLRRRPRIAAAIAEMEKLVRVQIGKVLSDLEFTRLAALAKGDLATAARCSELQGKHIGMFYERSVLTLDDTQLERYDQRRAEQAAAITSVLIMQQVLQGPLQPAALAAGQAPQTRQESESAK